MSDAPKKERFILRAVMRLGWEIANPLTAYNASLLNPFPFAVYGAGGTVSGVTVTPPSATVAEGETQQFSAEVEGSGIISQDVEWSVSGSSAVAGGTTVVDGLLTVGTGETNSSLTVTAKSKQDSGKSGTATVTVGE